MKVLIATHHYYDLTGSETFAYTLAKTLMFKGCYVTIYSPYIGGVITEKTLQLGIPVLSRLEEIKEEKFDVIHLSHNLVAMEVRYHFPNTPIVLLSHGVIPFLEQPPLDDLNISTYLVVSEEVRNNFIRRGISNDDILIFRNIIDTQRFYPLKGIRENPKTVLVNSRRMDRQTQSIVTEACKRLGLEMTFIGNPENIVWEVEKHINEADICISLGRGVLEAMSCGRAAIVFDYNGGDGLVTVDNIDEIQKCNFSGRRFQRRFSVETLIDEIKKYTKPMGMANRVMVEERFSAEKNVDALIDIYEKAIGTFKPKPLNLDRLNHFENIITETRNYSSEIVKRRFDNIVRDKDSTLINLQWALLKNHQNIDQLQILLGEKDSEIKSLRESINQKATYISDLETERREKEATLLSLQSIQQRIESKIPALEAALSDKNAYISHLEGVAREMEAKLNHIYHSHGWVALRAYYRVRDAMLPSGTWRRNLSKRIFSYVNKAIGMQVYLRKPLLNRNYLKKFFWTLRNRGPASALRIAAIKLKKESRAWKFRIRPLKMPPADLTCPEGSPLADRIHSLGTPVHHLDEAAHGKKDPATRKYRVIFMIGCLEFESKRYRVFNLIEAFKLNEVESDYFFDIDIPSKIQDILSYDVIVLFRTSLTENVDLLIKKASALHIPIVFDVDDYVFEPAIIPYVDGIRSWSIEDKKEYERGVLGYKHTLETCDYVTAPTSFLVKMAAKLGKKAYVVRNTLNQEQIEICEKVLESKSSLGVKKVVRIGYFSGTHTHQKDFAVAYPALLKILEEFDNVKLIIGGHLDLDEFLQFKDFGDRVEKIPFVDWRKLPYEIGNTDINIIPLEVSNPFCNAKSELKYFEAGILKIPSIASPTSTFREVITHRENGFLAETSEDWYACLKELIVDEHLRRAVGHLPMNIQ